MFKKILVAVDGSDHSLHAVAVAADIAQKFAATLVMLHVLGRGSTSEAEIREAEREHLIESAQATAPSVAEAPGRLGLSRKVDDTTKIRDVRHASGTELLRRAEKIARDRGADQIAQKLTEGNPAKKILEQAGAHDVDLIVMGARGLSDMQGLLLGSVSHKVSHLAACACLTVK